MAHQIETLEPVISLAKRRGFVFPGSDIYGGLKGTWDYGPLGVMLVNNLRREWWRHFVDSREDMYGLDASIIMPEPVWEASGHLGAGFSDPLVTDSKTGERYRADHLLKESGIEAEGLTPKEIDALIAEHGILSPNGNPLSPTQLFNLLFPVEMGASQTSGTTGYLRGETAQGIFVNFKNVVDTMNPKIPFGIAQVGKAFRNEIAPREWLFRVREFEQLEIEYFVAAEDWEEYFEKLRADIQAWHRYIGLREENVREYEVPANELAHYSKRTIDFEYNYPGKGFDELAGFAYRTDHDLRAHMEASGKSMEYIEPDGTRFVPHVLEPSFGLGRMAAAVIAEAYTEDEMNGETRTYLQLPTHIAPYRAAVSPLLKNKPQLVDKAREVFLELKQQFGNIAYDDNGNIGKRYRRQDEIGTPYCIVIDFDTLGETDAATVDTVTVRKRDTGEQERVSVADLIDFLA
jgi:glycyl-tRNA synthetase